MKLSLFLQLPFWSGLLKKVINITLVLIQSYSLMLHVNNVNISPGDYHSTTCWFTVGNCFTFLGTTSYTRLYRFLYFTLVFVTVHHLLMSRSNLYFVFSSMWIFTDVCPFVWIPFCALALRDWRDRFLSMTISITYSETSDRERFLLFIWLRFVPRYSVARSIRAWIV